MRDVANIVDCDGANQETPLVTVWRIVAVKNTMFGLCHRSSLSVSRLDGCYCLNHVVCHAREFCFRDCRNRKVISTCTKSTQRDAWWPVETFVGTGRCVLVFYVMGFQKLSSRYLSCFSPAVHETFSTWTTLSIGTGTTVKPVNTAKVVLVDPKLREACCGHSLPQTRIPGFRHPFSIILLNALTSISSTI